MVGQFFTPEIVAECMYRLAAVRPGQRVMDPSCGDGSFLRVAPEGLDLHACEVDPRYAEMTRRMVPEGHLVEGDALTSLVDGWGTCDLVIGNPPFNAQTNLEKRPQVLAEYDLGAGRKSQCLEVLFIELFHKLTRLEGRMAVILPDGPLVNRPFRYVRDWLLRRAWVEAIISLPREIFTGTSAKTSIIVAQRKPLAAAPYREPTWLLKCDRLDELKPLSVDAWRQSDPRWQSVILADEPDWRPEAQLGRPAENGEAWVRLGDVFRLRTGFAKYGKERQLSEVPAADRILLLRAKNLSPEGGFRLDRDLVYIERAGIMFREASVVRPGEILFVRVGAGCYGRTALVPAGLQAQADDWIHLLTPLRDVDGQGLVDWFNGEPGRAAVTRIAKGVGTVSVSKSSLADLMIPAHLVT